MKIKFALGRSMVCALLGILGATDGVAQTVDGLGSRASGLGAFVAVADDASAVVWNPAGMIVGSVFNLTIDVARSKLEPAWPPSAGARGGRQASTLIALSSWPVGLAYYRVTTVDVATRSSGVEPALDRQDEQVDVRGLVTTHVGATVIQSLGSNLAIGATAKLVRGSVAQLSRTVTSWDEAFTSGERALSGGTTRGDVDLGVLAWAGPLRAGLLVRNLSEPVFGDASGTGAVTLKRSARLGVAWGDRWPGMSSTIVAVDADLTRAQTIDGERRDVALGAERWLGARRLAFRGGIAASTIGPRRVTGRGGVSIAVRQGLYLDGFVEGNRQERRAWGVAARVAY